MLKQWQHVTGVTVAVVGVSFAASFGGVVTASIAYGLAAVLGVVTYVQGDRHATAGTVAGNVLIGYLVGVFLSLAVATWLLTWLLGIPPDFGAWQMGLLMWDSWAGLGVALLTGFFLAGLTALF